jgi:hypothetical protein
MATGNILEILVSRCMVVPKNSEQFLNIFNNKKTGEVFL